MLKKKVFTLIELLVVISIIGILITILIPSLRKARTAVRSAVCMSNLQQLATWGIAYATDSDQILPSDGNPFRPSYTEISNTSWFEKYPGYVKRSPSGTAMHCPQATMSITPRYDWYARNDFDYGLNMYLGGQKRDWTPEKPRAHLLTSEKYWFADGKISMSGGNGYFVWENMNATETNRTSWMWEYPELLGHPQQKSNFVFGDGHVGSRSKLSVISLSGQDKLDFRGTATE